MTNPPILPTSYDKLPQDVQNALKVMGFQNDPMKHCGHCQNIWVEYNSTSKYAPGPTKEIIGIYSNAPGKGMSWPILEMAKHELAQGDSDVED
jgi:hypothetical protein